MGGVRKRRHRKRRHFSRS